ncbi:MAG: hypothetical protein M1831_005164 [Alyxoria varia]|nr:MAG: hypothetical protein M1831_005164 [Alyxoria varia]
MSSTQQNQRKFVDKLLDRKVLVFGGTSGIGFAVAEGALEHGAQVYISSSNPDKLARSLDRLKAAYPNSANKVRGMTCDLADPERLETNLTQLFEYVGKSVDHITFTAGNSIDFKPMAEWTPEYIISSRMVRNLAPYMLVKVASAYMAPGPNSSITFTSGTNSTKPAPGWAVLAGCGTDIEGMVRGLAVDLKPIRVNLISPGAVETELLLGMAGDNVEAMRENVAKGTLVGTIAKPEDVAEAYLYVMRDRFFTGTMLSSDGGRLLV